MKLVLRADDGGYTKVGNLGAAKAIEEGVVTSWDVMLDCPGTEDALERIRSWPWISLGWHTHFWGRPLTAPERVPSLVDPRTGFFRTQLSQLPDADYDELLTEMRAQLQRCVKIAGRAPDTVFAKNVTPFDRAVRAAADEFGIAYDFATKEVLPGRGTGRMLPSARYAPLDIYMPTAKYAYEHLYADEAQRIEADSAGEISRHSPVQYLAQDPDRLAAHRVGVQAFHPGFVDDYILWTNRDHNFSKLPSIARVLDVESLCSPEMRKCIREHRIELVNFRDALYGTREYQQHLEAAGSELAASSW